MDIHTTPRPVRRRLLIPIATMAFEVTAAVALVALGRTSSAHVDLADPRRWLATTPPTAVTFALLRWLALGLLAYLLASTVIYVGARATGIPRLVRAAAPLALPSVRRAVDGALAGTLLTATIVGAGPVAAVAATPASASSTDTLILPPALRTPTREATNSGRAPGPPFPVPVPTSPVATSDAPPPPTPTGPTEPTEPSTPTGPSAAPATATTWVAAPGDSLWHVAEHLAADATGTSHPDDAAVATVWRDLVAANRPTIASGDVDLVMVGEHLRIPPDADGGGPTGAGDAAPPRPADRP